MFLFLSSVLIVSILLLLQKNKISLSKGTSMNSHLKINFSDESFSDICGLISLNTDKIKHLLFSSIHNDMVRCEVVVDNVNSKNMVLRTNTVFASESHNSVVIAGIYRSSPFCTSPVLDFLHTLNAPQMNENVANQINLNTINSHFFNHYSMVKV